MCGRLQAATKSQTPKGRNKTTFRFEPGGEGGPDPYGQKQKKTKRYWHSMFALDIRMRFSHYVFALGARIRYSH